MMHISWRGRIADPTNVDCSHVSGEALINLMIMQIESRAQEESMTAGRSQKRHAEIQSAHGRWPNSVCEDFAIAGDLPVGSCVGATRFPQYGKWLQRERRMDSDGVEARIHRQACTVGW